MGKNLDSSSSFLPKPYSFLVSEIEQAVDFEMASNGERRERRPWRIHCLLESEFYKPCLDHKNLPKNEMIMFCINCNCNLCRHCLSSSSSLHCFHKILQIRKYVYNNVVQVKDMKNLLDCSNIQTYTTNKEKVVHLNPRETKSNGGFLCEVCERSMSESHRFCSIKCKVSRSPEAVYELITEDMRASSHSLEEEEQQQPSSSSTSLTGTDVPLNPLSRRKRRRKGSPRRSPFF